MPTESLQTHGKNWCRNTCPTCGRLSERPVPNTHGGVTTVTHLCSHGHIWTVQFLAAVAA